MRLRGFEKYMHRHSTAVEADFVWDSELVLSFKSKQLIDETSMEGVTFNGVLKRKKAET